MLGYEKDIKPMFRIKDVDAMKPRGLNLWAYMEVRAAADKILSRLQAGSMPCDGPWQAGAIARFQTVDRRWEAALAASQIRETTGSVVHANVEPF